MKEVWKDIKGYEGLYQVSNLGKIRGIKNGKNKIRKPSIHHGYERITLSKDNKLKSYFIHVLVAEAFIPNPSNLEQVNHKDEIKTNNTVQNLEWCSPLYNCNYGTRNKRLSDKMKKGTEVYHKIQKTRHEKGCSMRKIRCITTGETFNSLKEASDKYKGSIQSNMAKHVRGERKYCGYTDDGTKLQWEYLDNTEVNN